MSARSGRAVVGFDVISHTIPSSFNSELQTTVFEEVTTLSPRSSQLSYMSPTECSLCPIGTQYVTSYNSSQRGVNHTPHGGINHAPHGGMNHVPHGVMNHTVPAGIKHPLCEFCEELKEWTNPEHREEHSHKVEWCSDCGKKDVGPPCKCNITGCSEGPINPYLQWQQDDNRFFYDNPMEAIHNRPPQRYANPSLMRTSSECTLAQLNSVEDRLRFPESHCRDPQSAETIVLPINVLHPRSSSSLRARVPRSRRSISPRTPRESWSQSSASPRTRETWSRASMSPRLSRSLEDLPRDIKEHIMKCRCSCDHLGYGNFSSTSLQRLTGGLSNGLSPTSSKHSSQDDLARESPSSHKQRELDIRSHLWGVVCLVLVLAGVAGVGVSVPLALRNDSSLHLEERIEAAKILLRDTPLVDGHNDLPWNIRKFMHNKLHSFNMTADLSSLRPWSRSSWSHTDLPRLKQGHVGAQFWVSYVPCESQYLNAVQLTIEQIDLIKRLIDQYPDDLQLALSAEDVESSFRHGRIASLIGVEGGHAIQNSLGVLRALYDLGVRYMTLTHTCSTPWAESARNKESDLEDPESPRGLTHFGKTVVREMNRVGLLVDLSHVSQATMIAALQVTKAPVLFSHSSVYAICKNPRNVPDDILRKVAENGGLVMISFYNHFLTCNKEATIRDVVDHINHVRNVAGINHVGIGADFDGVDKLPKGLEDVSKYPNLFAELMADSSWTEEDLKKLAGLNLLRVLRNIDKVRIEFKERQVKPLEMEVPPNQLKGKLNCSYNFVEDNPS